MKCSSEQSPSCLRLAAVAAAWMRAEGRGGGWAQLGHRWPGTSLRPPATLITSNVRGVGGIRRAIKRLKPTMHGTCDLCVASPCRPIVLADHSIQVFASRIRRGHAARTSLTPVFVWLSSGQTQGAVCQPIGYKLCWPDHALHFNCLFPRSSRHPQSHCPPHPTPPTTMARSLLLLADAVLALAHGVYSTYSGDGTAYSGEWGATLRPQGHRASRS